MHRLINGIVLSKVGGEYMLITTRPAWKKCPYIKVLSPIYAMFWHGLEKGIDEKDIIKEIHENLRIKESVLEKLFSCFITEISAEGYLSDEGNA